MGFYSVPNAAVTEPQQAGQGFGFGCDKARNRHNIRKFSAIGFILKSPYNFETANDTGPGWNFVTYARKKERSIGGGEWKVLEEQKLIAATSEAKPGGVLSICLQAIPLAS